MNTKTMEGLVGARTNLNLMNTPMRVFKEARRKGDTATMERSMGYVNEFSDKAQEYRAEADEGMEEDAKEAREEAKLQCAEAVRKRREEREKAEERMEENRNACADTETGECLLEISEEGKALSKGHVAPDGTGIDEIKAPVTYTKTGEPVPAQRDVGVSVSVSI